MDNIVISISCPKLTAINREMGHGDLCDDGRCEQLVSLCTTDLGAYFNKLTSCADLDLAGHACTRHTLTRDNSRKFDNYSSTHIYTTDIAQTRWMWKKFQTHDVMSPRQPPLQCVVNLIVCSWNSVVMLNYVREITTTFPATRRAVIDTSLAEL